MTIAAGLLYDKGVLLCADTQIELSAAKIHSPKIGSFEFDGGKIGFVMAGAGSFAVSAIQKCCQNLKHATPEEVVPRIESVLADEYERLVFRHPNQLTDWNLRYWFLISYWSPTNKLTSLFATEEHSLRAVNMQYECIGIGRELAHYIFGSCVSPEMSEQQALLLATYMLERVKRSVPGCGGDSHLLVLRHDGTSELVLPFAYTGLAKTSAFYDKAALDLLFACADNSLSDSQFGQHIDAFAGVARGMRQTWKMGQLPAPMIDEAWKKHWQGANPISEPGP